MNQLPKDVIINIIIPKIVEDKDKEISELKDVIIKFIDGPYSVTKCSECKKNIIYRYNEQIIVDANTNTNYIFIDCDCDIECYECHKKSAQQICIGCGAKIETYKALIII
jgi:hypothetical protein